jgi:hypothetical protein
MGGRAAGSTCSSSPCMKGILCVRWQLLPCPAWQVRHAEADRVFSTVVVALLGCATNVLLAALCIVCISMRAEVVPRVWVWVGWHMLLRLFG